MDRTCTRCARLAARPQQPWSHCYRQPASRTFATSMRQRADDGSQNSNVKSPMPVNQSMNEPKINIIRKVSSAGAPTQAGQILRRTAPSRTPSASQGRDSQPPNVLVRTVPSSQSGQVLRRTVTPRQGGRPGATGKNQGPPTKKRQRRTAESVKAKEAEREVVSEEEMDEYITKYIDRPANPTEPIPYDPKPQDMVELRKDWPNTPMSTTGLSASLVQKIEWLARRIPHGYQTPGQLAEHFQQGNLTRFESEEEKQQVLKIAAELAQKRASTLSERKGSEVAAEDMNLVDLSSRGEKTKLVGETVSGQYGDLDRQRMPFLDSVMRNLRNNETYHQTETDKFMATVRRLMPAQVQRRTQQQN